MLIYYPLDEFKTPETGRTQVLYAKMASGTFFFIL